MTSANQDGAPLGALTWPGTWIVTEQTPVAGSTLERWGTVVVRFEQGGEAGDGEPRRPPPQARLAAARAERRPDSG